MIGLIPAAGQATRIHGLPKFLLPVPEGHLLGLVCQRMTEAGVGEVQIGTGDANFALVCRCAPSNAGVYVVNSATMSETLLAARRYINIDQNILFAMPDTYWTDEQALAKLAVYVSEFGADVAVGAWRIRPDQRGKLGQLDMRGGRVTRVIDKNPTCPSEWAWGAIAWRPAFWQFIRPDMPHVGYALQPAIDAGLNVRAVPMTGSYFDCGTPQLYFACIREQTPVQVGI
jgi:dTDP-glucose pyrophosphorylase